MFLIYKNTLLKGGTSPKTNTTFSQMERRFLLKTIIAFCIYTGMALNANAQDALFPFPPFEKITTEQGLSNNEVYAVMQDKQGFLWALTSNGLNRFDGYTFKTYDYNPTDSNSITAGMFYSLQQDKKGIFWMNSENQGIYSFDPITGLFFNYRHNPHSVNSLADDLTQGLTIDENGNIKDEATNIALLAFVEAFIKLVNDTNTSVDE